MAVRVHDATEAPSILVGNRPHGLRPGFYRTRESSVGIIDRQNHTDSSAIQRLRAEVRIFWRFVRNPEIGVIHTEVGDDGSIRRIHAKQHAGSKRSLVKVHSLRTTPNREQWRNRRFLRFYIQIVLSFE